MAGITMIVRPLVKAMAMRLIGDGVVVLWICNGVRVQPGRLVGPRVTKKLPPDEPSALGPAPSGNFCVRLGKLKLPPGTPATLNAVWIDIVERLIGGDDELRSVAQKPVRRRGRSAPHDDGADRHLRLLQREHRGVDLVGGAVERRTQAFADAPGSGFVQPRLAVEDFSHSPTPAVELLLMLSGPIGMGMPAIVMLVTVEMPLGWDRPEQG